MPEPGTPLAQAERHVREGEQRVARQAALVARLARRGLNATEAQIVLEHLQTTLELFRDHLWMERQGRLEPRPSLPDTGTGGGAFEGHENPKRTCRMMAEQQQRQEDRGLRAGLAVLVAEDRGFIANQVAMALRRGGCVVVGPAATLQAALSLAQGNEAIGAAVLDIDLRGEAVYPVAEILRDRGLPFLFLTGFGAPIIPEPWRDAPRLEKPFDPPALLVALRSAIAQPPPTGQVPAEDAAPPSRVVQRAWEAIRRSRDLITEGRIAARQGGFVSKQ
ncbi:response regulator [Sabulicella rubraurantiaca]|uniref:hypothetical protein n=1 Tax=Sabulicella rubraurantiaca TaxID=2811429 RepID=UPI001A96E051|nr:hypothetical protein [Sabulicella rubraurantiaca]